LRLHWHTFSSAIPLLTLVLAPVLALADPDTGRDDGESVSIALHAAVLDTSTLNSLLQTIIRSRVDFPEPRANFPSPPLNAVELVFAEAIGIERALLYIPRTQIILSKTLPVRFASRETALAGFQRDPEAESDEWFLKVAVHPLSIDPKRRVTMVVQTEAVRFAEDSQSVAAADLLRLGIGKTLLAVLDLPPRDDQAPSRTILLLVRPEPARTEVPSPAEKKKSDIEAAIMTARIDLDIENMPLATALLRLRQAIGQKVSIIIDPTLPPEIAATPVGLSASQISVGEALDRILSRLGLAYELDAYLLFITTPKKVHNIVVKIYPQVMQLLFEAHNVDPEWEDRLRIPAYAGGGEDIELYRFTPPLISQYILEHVEPESWRENGGRGSIEYSDTLGVLIIRQTPENHSRIAQLLDILTRPDELPTDSAAASQTQNETH